jgi:hypothetical protein
VEAEEALAEVPAPTLFVGMVTALAAGGFVGWALLPLSAEVAGLPLYAVAAVATTLWSGVSFLRRELPTGVLAEGFYLMGIAVLVRPVAVTLALEGLPAFIDRPGSVLVGSIVAIVVAVLLLAAGWRLDTHARKTRVRRMRRRITRRMSRKRSEQGSMASAPSDSEATSALRQGRGGTATFRSEREP